jgi:hypothetical protein
MTLNDGQIDSAFRKPFNGWGVLSRKCAPSIGA